MIDMEKALTSMQPEVVAHLLSEVEKRWEESRVASLRKHVDETTALADMSSSCTKVAKAIIEGSDGDKDKVVEYMHDVCQSPSTDSKSCNGFATAVEGFMSNDAEVNRDTLDLPKFCKGYWADAVTKAASIEVKRLESEDAARAKEEEETKKHEAEEAKAEQAEEAKKAEEAAAAQETQDLAQAEHLGKVASDDEAKVSADVKETQAQIQLQQSSVDGMVDKARQALQMAAEKEAQAAEAKVTEEPKAAPAADEVAAEKAGDSEADRIAEKALANAQKAVEKAQEHIANDKEPTVNDTAAAVTAGDKLADKIAAKAAMIATKTDKKPAVAKKVDVSKEVFKVFFRVTETKKNGTKVVKDEEANVAFNEKPLVKEILATANHTNVTKKVETKVAKKA
jgi:hypothetical protein